MDEELTPADVAADLKRSIPSVRIYLRYEGLVYSIVRGRTVVKRSDLEEWKSRPEIQAMLLAGDHKRNTRARLAATG